ncbi:MAG: tandem-95 repeat protein, partial [Actinobacteria bacterium]|nr:tandem-95 repeat protein [Actinomycetota bacterium]
SSVPRDLTVAGNTLFFSASSDASPAQGARELWKSDGTALGTVQVKDINPGTGSSYPANFAAVASTVYFSADDGTTGTELWTSDGTDAGTVRVADINPGSFSSSPSALTPVRGTMYFAANDGTTGFEPWRLTLSRANSAPVAANDAYSTNEDVRLDVAAPGVLANDTDADGDPLTAGSPTTPAHGSVALRADGSFTYTPAANYNGPDAFTYLVSDGWGGSARATVTITVAAVNDAPTCGAATLTTNQDTAGATDAACTDIDGDPLTYAIVAQPAHGTASVSGAKLNYTPNTGYTGTDSFTYKANDGTIDSNVATVAVTVNAVNRAPVAAGDAYATRRDTALSVAAPGVLANDTDADANPLTAIKVSDPAHGSVTLGANGSFTYTPAAGYT